MTSPSGFLSVMAGRQPTDPDDLDFFPTPPWAARAGGELIRSLDPDALTCWEPAAGAGHMAHGLAAYFPIVIQSDIHRYERRVDPICARIADFLDPADDFIPAGDVDWIVTNPPFARGEEFVRRAWDIAGRGVAMLLRLSFLEGGARHKLLYDDCPLTVVAPFAERVPMTKGRWDPNASTATAYAWFIWLKPEVSGDLPCWPTLRGIAPGAKARLTHPDDARLFAELADAPLLDGAA